MWAFVLILMGVGMAFNVIHNVSKRPMTEGLALAISCTASACAFFAFPANEFLAAYRVFMFISIGVSAIAFCGHMVRAARS